MEIANPMSNLFKRQLLGENTLKKVDSAAHIQNRMSSSLQSLNRQAGKRKLAVGRTMGGAGRLTDSLIDSLQVYYSKAIRDDVSNIDHMKKAVMVIFYLPGVYMVEHKTRMIHSIL